MASALQLIFLSFLVCLSLCNAAHIFKPESANLSSFQRFCDSPIWDQTQCRNTTCRETLVLDVGGQHFWMKFNEGYDSSTYKPSPCASASCSVAEARRCVTHCNPNLHFSPMCHNNTCYVTFEDRVYEKVEVGVISRDSIALRSTSGKKPGPLVIIPDFIFACANAWNISNLASGSKGMFGLGRFAIGMPLQLYSSFGGSVSRKFATCLSSSSNSNGVIFFGDSLYMFDTSYDEEKGD